MIFTLIWRRMFNIIAFENWIEWSTNKHRIINSQDHLIPCPIQPSAFKLQTPLSSMHKFK
jgi:hypothetical protein